MTSPLHRMREGIDAMVLDILEHGEIVTDKDDRPILDEQDEPRRMTPTAAMLNACIRWYQTSQGDGEAPNSVQEALDQMRAAQGAGGEIPPIDDEDDAATP